jgi:hypothetical protein
MKCTYPRSIISNNNNCDLILIDGRFRVACAFHCFNVINNKCFVIIDDFFDRPYYYVVLNYYSIIEQGGRMVVLLKKNVPAPSQILLGQYEIDPR